MDLRWTGRHLSLVGHLREFWHRKSSDSSANRHIVKEVGLTVLEEVFTASQPVAFYKVLQQLNNVSMGPSENGMTAVDYVKIYLRDAEDSRSELTRCTLYCVFQFNRIAARTS